MNIIGHSFWFYIKTLIYTAAGIYICLVVLLYLFQSRFIYFPDKNISLKPDVIGLKYEDITFGTPDNLKLHGWFIPAENSRGTLLFCHGNAGNISGRLESIRIFNNLRMNVFIFDYRGYGQSEGEISEAGTYQDVEAAWNYLVETCGIRPGEIIIFGRSLGGSIAAWLGQYKEPRALIIESAFTSIPGIASDVYPFLPVKLLSRFKYDTVDYVSRVKSPILIIHSRNDELIPFKHGQKLFEAANEPKDFLEISGSHNDGFYASSGIYSKGLDSFISSVTGK